MRVCAVCVQYVQCVQYVIWHRDLEDPYLFQKLKAITYVYYIRGQLQIWTFSIWTRTVILKSETVRKGKKESKENLDFIIQKEKTILHTEA